MAAFRKQFSVREEKDKERGWQKEKMVRQSEPQVASKKAEPGPGKTAAGAGDQVPPQYAVPCLPGFYLYAESPPKGTKLQYHSIFI